MGEERDPLPVFGGLVDPLKMTPTLDQARARLGGAWVGGPDIGALVTVPGVTGERTGVVVHATPTERDVWIGAGRIQRVRASSAVVSEAGPDNSQAALIADAKMHAGLVIGERVQYRRPDGSLGEGALAEKLRYGSLVGTDEGKVLAVSFRRVIPIVTEHAT